MGLFFDRIHILNSYNSIDWMESDLQDGLGSPKIKSK